MNSRFNRPYIIASALILASLINTLPMMIFPIGGDSIFHLEMIDCFSTQFWQGDFYPRWCFNANAGLGAPTFFFYFPAPYYIAALLYPLTYIGISLPILFVFLCFLATVLTAFTCFSWLNDIVRPNCAVLATTFFLVMPYRSEMIFGRTAYAEMWYFALLPLLFKYIRRLAIAQGNPINALALIVGLLFLCHVPCTIIAVLFGGCYMLMTTGRAWKPKIYYGFSVCLGISLAAFYVVPGAYYRQFIFPVDFVMGGSGWANGFINIIHPIIGSSCILVVLLLTWFFYRIRKKIAKIESKFVRREVVVWAILSAVSFYLLIPISAPIYMIGLPFSKIIFPWRMQAIMAAGLTYMMAVWMQWVAVYNAQKLWQGDYAVAISLFLLIGCALFDFYHHDDDAERAHLRAAGIINLNEYRNKWTDEAHWSLDYIFSIYKNKDDIEKYTVLKGNATVDMVSWGWKGMEFKTKSAQPFTVRIQHNYFPVWKAIDTSGKIMHLYPEEKTGQMLLDIPAGERNIRITYSALHGSPYLIISNLVSIAAWLAIGSVILWRKRFDKPQAA